MRPSLMDVVEIDTIGPEARMRQSDALILASFLDRAASRALQLPSHANTRCVCGVSHAGDCPGCGIGALGALGSGGALR